MVKLLFEFFIPPAHDSAENIRRWRIAMAIGLTISSAHILWACGFLEFAQLGGFAYASDVRGIRSEILERSIFDARIRQCTATSPESKRFYANQVQELLGRLQLVQPNYRLPSCNEVS
jgi:hypothetical protein